LAHTVLDAPIYLASKIKRPTIRPGSSYTISPGIAVQSPLTVPLADREIPKKLEV